MELWWLGLNLELQIFYGIGALALIALIVQFVLLLVGGFDDVGDFGDAGGLAEHGSGLGIFSFRGITAFFLGFGWTGAIAVKSGLSVPVAILQGLLVGMVLMIAIFLMMRSMMRLQSSGTLDYQNAVGEVATVYVTVPGSGKAGGQVEVMIQGRLSVAEALHRGEASLAPGSKVRIVEMMGRSTLVVEPLLS
jgi:membrane protein implicated in regulation of membrane protease activity